MSIIKIFRIDQPLRFRIKNLIISVGMQKIKFVYAHFIIDCFVISKNGNHPLKKECFGKIRKTHHSKVGMMDYI